MALTVAQKISLFQILDVPYSTSYNTLDGMGTLSSQTEIASVLGQAYTQIIASLAALDADVETELETLITEWDTIGLNSGTIDGGSIGDIGGASFDWDRKREIIRSRVKIILPYYRWHEVLERRAASTSGMNVRLIR